jgi:pentatricopeptide repeat protein
MFMRDVVYWKAMISSYGLHGNGKDALELFFKMRNIGLKPNHITFIHILSVCNHAGLVEEGC